MKDKKGILVVGVILILVILIFVWAKPNKKKENLVEKGKEVTEAAEGEFTKKEADGTVVNTSKELNKDKEEEGFKIQDISFKEVNGETVLEASVTNNTNEKQTFKGNIALYDKAGNEIGRIPVRISDMEIEEEEEKEKTGNRC